MSVAVKTIPNRTATIAIGSCSGSDTYQNFFRPVAPSIAAASSTSCGIDAMPGEEDHRRERDRPPRLHEDDRRPSPAFGVPSQVGWFNGDDEVQVDEEPGEDARLRVVEPEEADRGQRDRRRPRQQDHEAEDPAARERVDERVRDQAGAERRRSPARSRVKRNVCQIASTKIGSSSCVPEVAEPDPVAAERAGGRVGEAEVDREHERRADERADEEHRRRDEERRKEAAALRRGTGAAGVGSPLGSRPLPFGSGRANVTGLQESRHRGCDRARAADEGLRGRHARRPGARPRGRGRRVRRLRRPVRLRQDDRAADDRRARGHHRRGRCASAGSVVNDLPPKARDMAMIFQNYALYPHMNVYDNMAFGLKMRGIDRAEIRRRVESAARDPRARRRAEEAAAAPLGRPAPARRDGPRDRARAGRRS